MKKISKSVILLLGLLFSLEPLRAQEAEKESPKDDWFWEYTFRYGRGINNFNGLDFWNIHLYGFDFRVGKQTFGKSEWSQRLRYPAYGLALRYGHWDNELLGDKLALFFFIDGNFLQKKWFAFRYQFGAGLAYFTHPYDFETNPDNIVVGSRVTAHIDLNLSLAFRVTKQLELSLKGNFSHSSNGAIKFPNFGINDISANLGVRYHLQPMPDKIRTVDTCGKFIPVNSFHITVVPTFRRSKKDYQAKPDDGSIDRYANNPTYFAGMLQLGYYRQFHLCYRYGAGLDLMYNSELRRHFTPEEHPAEWKYMSCAAYVSFEVLYNRFVLHTALAVYLYQNKIFYEPYYERVGFKILLGKKKEHYVGACLKAHAGQVDYVEWTYGWDFIHWQDKKKRAH